MTRFNDVGDRRSYKKPGKFEGTGLIMFHKSSPLTSNSDVICKIIMVIENTNSYGSFRSKFEVGVALCKRT